MSQNLLTSPKIPYWFSQPFKKSDRNISDVIKEKIAAIAFENNTRNHKYNLKCEKRINKVQEHLKKLFKKT